MRGVMREIEAQAAGLDHAAGLLDVRAEHLAQRGVQQMRGGVIAHGGMRATARSTSARSARRRMRWAEQRAMLMDGRAGTPG